MFATKPHKEALRDVRGAFETDGLSLYLAWTEIRLKYIRSIIGPFWITISTAVTVLLMGPIYAFIFSTPIAHYITFLAVSFVLWNFISQTINEAPQLFVSAEALIKHQKIPFSVFIFKHLFKANVILAHNAIIFLFVALNVSGYRVLHALLFLAGFVLVNVNLLWISTLLSVLGSRYRDVQQAVVSVVQALFFLSPIMWQASIIPPENSFVYNLNPVYHLVEVVRAPLLAKTPGLETYLILFFTGLVGLSLSFHFFAKYRARIPYWL